MAVSSLLCFPSLTRVGIFSSSYMFLARCVLRVSVSYVKNSASVASYMKGRSDLEGFWLIGCLISHRGTWFIQHVKVMVLRTFWKLLFVYADLKFKPLFILRVTDPFKGKDVETKDEVNLKRLLFSLWFLYFNDASSPSARLPVCPWYRVQLILEGYISVLFTLPSAVCISRSSKKLLQRWV